MYSVVAASHGIELRVARVVSAVGHCELVKLDCLGSQHIVHVAEVGAVVVTAQGLRPRLGSDDAG